MENASKALLIIGAVLIAIIVITGLIYLTKALGDFAGTSEEAKEQAEIAKFNKQFEAYNKERLYGTDIISIVNKADENNEKYNVENTNPFYITIQINLGNKYITTYTEQKEGESLKEKTYSEIKNDLETNFGITEEPLDLTVSSFSTGSIDTVTKKYVRSNSINFFRQNMQNMSKTIRETESGKEIEVTYSVYPALAEFKKAVFKCESIRTEYNENGRITKMEFSEL